MKGCISEEENSYTVFYLFRQYKKLSNRLSSRTLQNSEISTSLTTIISTQPYPTFPLNNLKHSVQVHLCFKVGQDQASRITSTIPMKNNSKTSNLEDEDKAMITFIRHSIHKYRKVSFCNQYCMNNKAKMIRSQIL